MGMNLLGRSILKPADLHPDEFLYVLDLAEELKGLKAAGSLPPLLKGKSLALLFEKASTRTRCAFAVACAELGAHPEFLGKDDIHFGKKESVRDTARVLGRMFDGIEYRGFSHGVVEDLARDAGVPVYNGLTDLWHPTQVLADLMTIRSHVGSLRRARLAYLGDARNNMGHSLLVAAALTGMDLRIAAPRALFPDREIVAVAEILAQRTGARLTIAESVADAVRDVDAIYTDVWASMGEEDKLAERIALLRAYQVTGDVLTASGNRDVIFMHCLPAVHDSRTAVGREVLEAYGMEGLEVTDDVFESSHSVVFEQAENRLHTIAALLVATLS